MSQVITPAIWLILFIVGLPQLSETVYTPALPAIAHALQVSEANVEYTLTIYLFGFAVGTLFWGKLSDHYGRKPCMVMGLLVFIAGCVGCYQAQSIEVLLASRFIQAFGGSIGSVLGQAVCRDAFQGPALGKVYATVSSALAVFPAIGPVVGGLIAEHFGWPTIFLCLILVGTLLCFMVIWHLPETHHAHNRQPVPLMGVVLSLLQNKKVIGFGMIVAGCNGINFSYFAEGSFFLIKLLGIAPSQYGLSFVAIAASTIAGGLMSKRLHDRHDAKTIIGYGLTIMFLGSGLFTLFILMSQIINTSVTWLVAVTVGAQMIMMFGSCMTVSNALALALVDYKWCIGTASSLFGFFYYCVISLLTFGMALFHNGTLLPMPLYFLGISVLMILVRKSLL
ncbi:multidrug effflux MFS transporter [Legionella oakridgensis]|uniref:Bcr/CflA family efflux transporter n=2 Tax=Legionella oakridgensis TaxID=29423 RepID=W0BAG9_9GAMM|nr:multidrug effflux MFS transporter [Legionella oakridgensis]AHE66830.1 drug resistance transporter, Bcr/CflA subfamily [Legionella oakridgensis ATCC 33761 = DSM 21215]KTD39778.1 multidrug resistance protein [Legionella oakridgensis]STY19943.1 multidrug resistance protein [Legionella longbeachae]